MAQLVLSLGFSVHQLLKLDFAKVWRRLINSCKTISTGDQAFWEGRVPQKSYMEQLSGIKDEMFAHQRALTEKFAKVFNQVLSECSHCDNLIGTIESL